jgi:hypothetical protein
MVVVVTPGVVVVLVAPGEVVVVPSAVVVVEASTVVDVETTRVVVVDAPSVVVVELATMVVVDIVGDVVEVGSGGQSNRTSIPAEKTSSGPITTLMSTWSLSTMASVAVTVPPGSASTSISTIRV